MPRKSNCWVYKSTQQGAKHGSLSFYINCLLTERCGVLSLIIAYHIQKHPRPQTEALNEGICVPNDGDVIMKNPQGFQLFACFWREKGGELLHLFTHLSKSLSVLTTRS